MSVTLFQNVDQCRQFLDEAKSSGVHEMFYIALATGLRQGELLGLKWEDIDLKNGLIQVKRQIAMNNGEIDEVPLKTENAYRTIHISSKSAEVLKQQRARIQNQKEEFIFPALTGGPISPNSMNDTLKTVLERAGMPKVRFHVLRHTFATLALQHGVDIKTVSGMLGLVSIKFTEST